MICNNVTQYYKSVIPNFFGLWPLKNEEMSACVPLSQVKALLRTVEQNSFLDYFIWRIFSVLKSWKYTIFHKKNVR